MHSQILHASFPNWDGKSGDSNYTIVNDELTYRVAKPSSGAADGARFIPLFKEVAAALSGAVAPVTSNGTTALETERLLEAIERTSGGD